ncbi:hypothetical protein BC833DRAFT_602259, partial [Globomyces pollinis-pini]
MILKPSLIHLIITQVYSESLMFSSQWIQSDTCTGPPTSMYSFRVSDFKQVIPTSNDTWSSIYKLSTMGAPYGYCGSLPVQIHDQCCVSSLDISQSDGYQSGMSMEINTSPPTVYHKDSSGIQYCSLHSENNGLQGYLDIYILANGNCIDKMTCTDSGYFTVYQNDNCSIPLRSIQLTSKLTDQTIPEFQNVSGMINKIPVSSIKTGWTTSLPGQYLVPNTNAFPDILQHICWGLSMLTVLLCFQLLFQKRKQRYFRILVMSQVCWIIYVSIYIFYTYSTSNNYAITFQFLGVFFNLATLSTTIHTSSFVLRFFNPLASRLVSFGLYVLVFLIHLLLSGSRYFNICFNLSKNCLPYNFMVGWKSLSGYWIVFMFIYNTIPSIFSAITLARKNGKKSVGEIISYIFEREKGFLIMLIAQVLNTIIYYTLICIQIYTPLAGSDRWFMFFGSIKALCLCIHNLINYFLIDSLLGLFESKNRVQPNQMKPRDEQSKIPEEVENANTYISVNGWPSELLSGSNLPSNSVSLDPQKLTKMPSNPKPSFESKQLANPSPLNFDKLKFKDSLISTVKESGSNI